MLTSEEENIRRREDSFSNDDSDDSEDSSSSSASESDSQKTTTITKPSATSSSNISAATIAASLLPTPLDSGFSANSSASCSNFINHFLSNAQFKSCLPFSLLLQNSNSFFQASKSLVSITQVLDASCSASSTTCNQLMTSLASNMTSSDTCSSDLSAQNAVITSVLQGLQAYQVLYTASCLKNPSSDAYCYAEAITNSSNPTDSFIYYLPLNTSLPAGGQPTCGTCTKDTMAIFEAATANRGSAIAGTYGSAALQTNMQCGPGFVNASLAATTSGALPSASQGMLGNGGLFALVLVVGSWLL